MTQAALLKQGADPYALIEVLTPLLEQGRSNVKIPFFINETDLLAGTAQQLVCPIKGKIRALEAVIQKTITTAGGPIIVGIGATAVEGLVLPVAVPIAMGGFQQDDGGVFTDDTTDMNDVGASDVAIFPATAAEDDACCFGARAPFDTLTINMGTQGAGTYTVAWEYWNGSAWTILSVTDGTTAFKAGTSTYDVTFTPPAAWAARVLGVIGPALFYIRAQIDDGTMTTDPLVTQGWTNRKNAGQVFRDNVVDEDGTEEVAKDANVRVTPDAAFAGAGEVHGWVEIEPI